MFTDDQRRELLGSFITDIMSLAQRDPAQCQEHVVAVLGDHLDEVLERQRQRYMAALETKRLELSAFVTEEAKQ